MEEVIRGTGESQVHSRTHHFPLLSQEFRPLLKAWGLIWENSGVRESLSYTSIAQGQAGGRECWVGDAMLVFCMDGK